jgi:hypothetical protein
MRARLFFRQRRDDSAFKMFYNGSRYEVKAQSAVITNTLSEGMKHPKDQVKIVGEDEMMMIMIAGVLQQLGIAFAIACHDPVTNVLMSIS